MKHIMSCHPASNGAARRHKRFGLLGGFLAILGGVSATAVCRGEAPTIAIQSIGVRLDPTTGLPSQIETRLGGSKRQWLAGPVRLAVRNEVTSNKAASANIGADSWQRRGPSIAGSANLTGLPLAAVQQWSPRGNAVAWELDFRGDAKRVAHEVTIELPMLSDDSKVFTPTERGVMDVAAYPTFQGLSYAENGWDTGQSWVLPLVSVMDPRSDHAVTIALPADANIPHLKFDWTAGKTLRISMSHRGMGGGKPSPLTLLLFAHPADYRAALRAYSDAFPRYFRAPMPRGPYEGTFWYHHIHDHPAPDEMARQSVRFIWSSFWFTHLGEYLPDAKQWEPYTYAKWWKLGKTIGDEKIRAFVRAMHARGIGTYAYFNVTEYGGAGGKSGDTAEAAKRLREKFADALVKDVRGNDIPTWEGAMAMNPGGKYSLWPFLEDQIHRHLTRLPEIDGFIIDRLDWAGQIDYAHDDGLSMVGDRGVENLAIPVAEAVSKVAKLAHAAGKRVFVNQFYRVEVLRDVDGACHENDYLAALGYLIPLRPASAWHMRKPYHGDLLSFEAQLKQRLHWALFPQMIAHQFPISQQSPEPRAADFLELYAPLFDTLLGKEQVLLPHCVQSTGANDANLFVNPTGNYVVPVTSRMRFLSRAAMDTESVVVTLRVPQLANLTWAHAISADGPSYRARIESQGKHVCIAADKHGSATMLVVGKGSEPALADHAAARREKILALRFAKPQPPSSATPGPGSVALRPMQLRLTGAHVGAAGLVTVLADGKSVGRIAANQHGAVFDWTPTGPLQSPPQVTLVAADEGTWFVPERIDVVMPRPNGPAQRLAAWRLGMAISTESSRVRLTLPLVWSVADMPAVSARFQAADALSAGRWKKRLGARAAWIPGIVGGDAAQNGFRMEPTNGDVCRWPPPQGPDPRVLDAPNDSAAPPTCWFADDRLSFRVVPPDAKPYRLTLYVLDYDRNGRAMEVALLDDFAPIGVKPVSVAQTAGGVYVTWTVRGAANVEVKKTAGFNAVVSGLFVDPALDMGQ